MKNTLLLTMGLFIGSLSTSALAQTNEQIGSYTQADIASLAATFGIPSNVYTAEYGVDAYKVLYTMPYMGEDIEVSGAMFLPTGVDPTAIFQFIRICTELFSKEIKLRHLCHLKQCLDT